MYNVQWVRLVVDPPTLLIGDGVKCAEPWKRVSVCTMNVFLMGNYELRQWPTCHNMTEGCVPLYFSYGPTARHMCCLPGLMTLQSKARPQWCASVAAKSVTPSFD